jgi:hypothetical protein
MAIDWNCSSQPLLAIRDGMNPDFDSLLNSKVSLGSYNS